jgi:predicted dithiol-disulfide oxidoreductase (DUF899 family)
MSIPTTVVSEQEWNAAREALLVEEDAPEGVPQQRTGSWVRRHDEYTPHELAGGRS